MNRIIEDFYVYNLYVEKVKNMNVLITRKGNYRYLFECVIILL